MSLFSQMNKDTFHRTTDYFCISKCRHFIEAFSVTLWVWKVDAEDQTVMLSSCFSVLQMVILNNSAVFTVFHCRLVQLMVAGVIEGRGERAALCWPRKTHTSGGPFSHTGVYMKLSGTALQRRESLWLRKFLVRAVMTVMEPHCFLMIKYSIAQVTASETVLIKCCIFN